MSSAARCMSSCIPARSKPATPRAGHRPARASIFRSVIRRNGGAVALLVVAADGARLKLPARGIARGIAQDWALEHLEQHVGRLALEDHVRGRVINSTPAQKEDVLDTLSPAIEGFTCVAS